MRAGSYYPAVVRFLALLHGLTKLLVLGLVALVVRDLGLVVFVVPVPVGQLCPLARCGDHSVNHSY